MRPQRSITARLVASAYEYVLSPYLAMIARARLVVLRDPLGRPRVAEEPRADDRAARPSQQERVALSDDEVGEQGFGTPPLQRGRDGPGGSREVLRLWLGGMPKKRIAAQLSLDPKAVRRYVNVAETSGLVAAQGPRALTDEVLTQASTGSGMIPR